MGKKTNVSSLKSFTEIEITLPKKKNNENKHCGILGSEWRRQSIALKCIEDYILIFKTI